MSFKIYNNPYIKVDLNKLCLLKDKEDEDKKELNALTKKLIDIINSREQIDDSLLDIVKKNQLRTYFVNSKFEGKRVSFTIKFSILENGLTVTSKGLLQTDNLKAVHLDEEEANAIENVFNPQIGVASGFQVFRNLNGNRFEICTALEEREAHPLEYWNNWEKMGSNRSDASFDYKIKIHPLFRAYFEILLKSPSTILEFCSGDARLALGLMEKFGEKITHYHLFELNEQKVKQAHENIDLTPFKNRMTVKKKDVTKVDSEFILGNEKVDFFIVSGGLTHLVLPSRQSALNAFLLGVKRVKIGGYALFGGHAPSWISKDDLEKTGFEVFNTFSPTMGKDFYVARKIKEM